MRVEVRRAILASALSGLMLFGLQPTGSSTAADCYPPGSCGGGLLPTPTEPRRPDSASPKPTPTPTTTPTPTPTPSPSSTQSQVPPIELQIGSAAAVKCEGATCVPISVTETVTSDRVTLVLGTGVTVQLRPVAAGGTRAQVGIDGVLVIPMTGGITVTMSGLTPGSYVDIYLNSERVLLGSAQVTADGKVNSTLPLPAGVAPGRHTAQVVGTDYTGSVVSASLGVLVKGAVPAASNRFAVVGVLPSENAKVAPRSLLEFKASLFGVATGVRLTAAGVAKLAPCTMKVSVKAASGKSLLAPICMAYGKKDGTARYAWAVPGGYEGRAIATITFKESGRAASTYSRTLTIG